MKIAIIGAGFTGLSAAYRLSKKGHNITVFEKDSKPGGLAVGYREKGWEWTLEKHYHHWFTNDKNVLNLARDINYGSVIRHPKTSVWIGNKSYQLDSPLSLLRFKRLFLWERLRMAIVLGLLRYNPFWVPMENINAQDFLNTTMGSKSYEMIWKPQLINKFGDFAKDISLAWFWARIRKRTSSLVYPKEGFLNFADALVNSAKNKETLFKFDTEVISIKSGSSIVVEAKNKNDKTIQENFDRLIVTLPSFVFTSIAPQLPTDYKQKLNLLKGLGAINLIMRFKKPFLKDRTYWLSICDVKSPFMAIVEHTNFMDTKYYNNEHLVYVGNYVSYDHEYMKMSESQLISVYEPYLSRIHPDFKDQLIGCKLFKIPFAQPVIPTGYSKIMPKFLTPLKNVYLANIQQVYPWDRGTNYAVELGAKISDLVEK